MQYVKEQNKTGSEDKRYNTISIEYHHGQTLLFHLLCVAKLRRIFLTAKKNIKKIQNILISVIFTKSVLFYGRPNPHTTIAAHIAQNYAKCAIPLYI